MNGVSGHVIAVALGAFCAGVLCLLAARGFFWAGLIGGALTGGAIRVAWVIATADDSANDNTEARR